MQKKCKAILFDMDGTLVDSTLCIEQVWRKWSQKHNLAESFVLSHVHGRRGHDVVSLVAPHLNADKEIALLLEEELQTLEGTIPIHGAGAFVNQLPRDKWCVVTSAPRELALKKLSFANIPLPVMIIGADDVSFGKPHPEPYLRAAETLGVEPSECLVFEDAQNGIESALSAGMTVIALLSSLSDGDITTTSAHFTIKDYGDIVLVHSDRDGIEIAINPLETEVIGLA